MARLVKVEVQQANRARVDAVVARIVGKAAGRTCGTCWRFGGCDQEPATPMAVACPEHEPVKRRG